MATNAIYVNGQALLPQTRDDSSVEWVYVDGQAGGLPVGQPSARTAATSAGSLTATGEAPTATVTSAAQTVIPDAGSLTATGAAPTCHLTLVCGAGTLESTGAAPTATVAAGPQVATAISDVAAGGWTPSTGEDLWAMVDETSASDTDYISSDATPTNDTAVLGLTPLETPSAGTVTLRIRSRWAA